MNTSDDQTPSGQAPATASSTAAQPGTASQGDGMARARTGAETPAMGEGALFEVLGTHQSWCYFRRWDGEVVFLTPQQMVKRGALLALVPDVDHWLMVAPPAPGWRTPDWVRAGAALARRAQEVGVFRDAGLYRWPDRAA